MKILGRIGLLGILLCLHTVTQAANCSQVINQIAKDIQSHSQDIDSQNFPWKNLSWLQKQLGAVKPTTTTAGAKQYQWACTDGTHTSLTVSANAQGKLVGDVQGQYNYGMDGAGLFSTKLAEASSMATTPAQTTATTPTQGAAVSSAATSASSSSISCGDLAKKIYDLAGSKPPSNTPPYAWEDLQWLKTHLGAGQYITREKMSGYMWKCSEHDGVFKFSLPQDPNIAMVGSVYCPATDNCFYSYVVRKDGQLKTVVMNLGGLDNSPK